MIMLDKDGVLADFVSAAMKVCGLKYDPDQWPKGVYGMEQVTGLPESEIWDRIHSCGSAFWANLKPYPWALHLVTELQKLDDVTIATVPSPDPSSYAGKIRWLKRHGLFNLPSMLGRQKWLLSGPGRILIDDSELNLKLWQQYGGESVLFPQPWNHGSQIHPDDVVEVIVDRVKQIQLAQLKR